MRDTPGEVREVGADRSYGRGVEPSSLVFVAIVAGWAAYLVPQWVRRREHLAASRTEDRHSDKARVLDPRSERPRAAGTSGGRLLNRRAAAGPVAPQPFSPSAR